MGRPGARVSALHNPLEVLRWNMDKRYLADLAGDDIPVVETQWIEPADEWRPPPGEFVIKPRISGGGIDTARYGPDDHQHAVGPPASSASRRPFGDGAAVCRPSTPTGDALVFVGGGDYSHAVTKGRCCGSVTAALCPHSWRREVISPASPSRAQTVLAEAALESVSRRFGPTLPLYSRIDVGGRRCCAGTRARTGRSRAVPAVLTRLGGAPGRRHRCRHWQAERRERSPGSGVGPAHRE